MPISGGTPTRIAEGLAWEVQPRFSPDGRRIAFTSDRAGGDNVWLMNRDGSNKVQVTKEDFACSITPTGRPQAEVHVLVIPKGRYVSWDDFSRDASPEEVAGFVAAVGKVARELGLMESGYRLLYNVGRDGGQEVPHLHAHIFGGQPLGRMIA